MTHKYNIGDKVIYSGTPVFVDEVRFTRDGLFYFVYNHTAKHGFLVPEDKLSRPFTIQQFIAVADTARFRGNTYVYEHKDKKYCYQTIQGLCYMTVNEPRRMSLYLLISDFIYHHEQDFV